jgi:hypothetical protein
MNLLTPKAVANLELLGHKCSCQKLWNVNSASDVLMKKSFMSMSH